MHNKYYEVVEPIYYLQRVGAAPSNTYIGASQAWDPIYEGKNAEPGDQFHLLMGGDFILNDLGETPPVSFWMPPHLFESHYHRRNSKELFQALEKSGMVREIPAPENYISYTPLSELQNLPQGTRKLTRIDNSPTYQSLTDHADDIIGLASDFGLKYPIYDFDEERRALLRIVDVNTANQLKAIIFEANVKENGRVHLSPNKEWIDCPSFIAALKNNPLIDPAYTYKDSMWANDVSILKDPELIHQIEVGLDNYLEKTNQKSVFLKP